MKRKLIKGGWSEVVTTNIILDKRQKDDPFMRVEIFINARNKPKESCNYCKKKWTELSGNVWIKFTNKGNKVLCDDCNDIITGKTLPLFDNTNKSDKNEN